MVKNYYKEAEEIITERREKAMADSDMRKEAVRRAIPEIAQIDAQISAAGTKILAAAMSGKGGMEAVQKIKAEGEALCARRREVLLENGYPADYSDVKFDCPLCSDTGFVGIEMCSCMKKCAAELRLADSDMGRLAETQSFESFSFDYYTGKSLENAHRNFDMLKSFAENFSKESSDNWLLLGDTGLGKTHLSTAVGVTVIGRGYDVIYKSVQSMIDDFENERFRGGDPQSIRKYYDCDLLIVDDLGVEMSNQFTISCLYNVFNSRINSRRSTVISTNLSQTELRDKYDDRITSRLFGEYKPLLFSGTDIRRQKLQKG